MGLDMYLSRRFYVGTVSDKKLSDALLQALGTKNPEYYSSKGIITVSLPEGYWRKANAIHNWFVETLADGEDNCQEIYVSREDLQSLHNICKQVLAKRNDPDGEQFAMETLPPKDGFFFGSTEIDDWYYSGLEHTVKICEHALDPENNITEDDTFIYRASW